MNLKTNIAIFTHFADVILPLSVPNAYTYGLSELQYEQIKIGHRVVINLGKSKQFTAIVIAKHQNKPSYSVKQVIDILDDEPTVIPTQLQLWDWISSYYLCYKGEVMLSALPNSLKLQSETRIIPTNSKFDGLQLSNQEFKLLESLQSNEVLTLKEASDVLQINTIYPVVKKLLDLKLVSLYEELHQKYKPKVSAFVTLNKELKNNESALKSIFDQLSRAPKQEELLLHYLQLSLKDKEYHSIKRASLLKKSNSSSAVLKGLIDKNILEIEEQNSSRIEDIGIVDDVVMPNLSSHQSDANQTINESFKFNRTVLLHGVTGSGKTEIYIHQIQDQIDKGKQVLYLLPEIAITTQIIQRLKRYFGAKVGVYHSKFSSNERVEVWQSLLDNEFHQYDIILGARSAIFLPYKNLGLIVVDEEHEPSYKQFDPSPRYHARDVAFKMSQMHGCNLLLGSATPSLEMIQLVKEKKIDHVLLTERYHDVALPEIQCADLKVAHQKKQMKGIFSPLLFEAMVATLKAGKQIILFQNRRGYAPKEMCMVCNWTPTCKRCDVSLTKHKYQPILKCHYCGYSERIVKKCGACGSQELKELGIGTQKIEEEIKAHFGDEPVVKRMDWDTTRKKSSFQDLIDSFENREVDILVGTQMVSKGLDFAHVGLVGILQADDMLKHPDFRAFERSFQLLTQVSGRSGRKHERGKVVMQSFDPSHWILQKVMEYNYSGMCRQELGERKQFNYPPFTRIIRLVLLHKKAPTLETGARDLVQRLSNRLSGRILGPEYLIIPRVSNYYQQQITLKVEKTISISKVKSYLSEQINEWQLEKANKSIRVKIDVDPI